MTERLVIVEPVRSEAELTQILSNCRVVAKLPPRLVVVEANDAEMEVLRGAPAISAVLTAVSELPKLELNEGEKLFVEAWHKRQRTEKKNRVGEGLPWDAEGFQPPDWPKK